MGTRDNWRVLLNERTGKNSRVIFTGHKHRSLVDITLRSEKVDDIIGTVLKSNWDAGQLIAFLDVESEKLCREAL